MLGIAFGKVIDISNVNNLTYSVLLIFKEFETLYASSWTGGPGPESSYLMRVVLPHSLHPLSHQDGVTRKRFDENEAYTLATFIDYTDGGRGVDQRQQLMMG